MPADPPSPRGRSTCRPAGTADVTDLRAGRRGLRRADPAHRRRRCLHRAAPRPGTASALRSSWVALGARTTPYSSDVDHALHREDAVGRQDDRAAGPALPRDFAHIAAAVGCDTRRELLKLAFTRDRGRRPADAHLALRWPDRLDDDLFAPLPAHCRRHHQDPRSFDAWPRDAASDHEAQAAHAAAHPPPPDEPLPLPRRPSGTLSNDPPPHPPSRRRSTRRSRPPSGTAGQTTTSAGARQVPVRASR